MKVLIIEDFDDSRTLMYRLLEHKADIIGVSNTDDARQYINDVDLIITDVCMPLINGDVFIHELRKNNIMTPAIIVTGIIEKLQYDDVNVVVIEKPFMIDDFLRVFEETIKSIKTNQRTRHHRHQKILNP